MPLVPRGPASPQGGDKASEAAVTVLPLPMLVQGTAVSLTRCLR